MSASAAEHAYRQGQAATDNAERRGHHQAGVARAREALASDPDDPAALLWYAANLGAEALTHGKLYALRVIPELERTLLRLEQKHPLYDEAAASRALGRLYHQAPPIISVGSNEKAAECFERALSRAPENAGTLAFAADLHRARGDCAQARALVQRLARTPGFAALGPDADEWRRIARAVAKRCG